MADGDELKVNAALLKALDLAPDEDTAPSLALILAACIQQLAVEYGLAEREDDRFSWVAHAIPGEPLRVLTDFICDTDTELTDDAVRDWLYNALLDISEDSVARKSLNKTSAVSRDEVLAFSQVYWNLEADGRRTELPIRSGQKLASGLMARIKAPNADVDLAGLDLKNRAAPAGFPKGGGAYYARGARIAVLIADRITRDNGTPPNDQTRLRLTQTGRGAEWSIVWPSREHVDTARPSRNAVALLTPAGLTSRARARHAIDSYEQDLRRAVQWYIPDELSPASVYGRILYGKLLRLQASADEPDTDTMAPYLHPQEAREVLLRYEAAIPASLADALRSSIVSFDRYSPVRNRIMRGRPLQPDDLDAVESFIGQFWSSDFPQTSLALEQLASDADWQPRSRPGSAPPELVLHNLPNPDFDETGLLGRDNLVNEVVAMVGRRRYPIMLKGEGGIGKTALALEVAYRFLDDPTSPFEAILWTSLKTERLTSEGVQDLSNALRDLGGVATSLGKVVDPSFKGTIAELGEAIGNRTTLIVVDNLETLHGDEFFALDDALSDRDVTFLLTSRVGLGDRTQTRDVGPLDEPSATQLFRKFARGSGSNDLAGWSDERVHDTLRELRCSPLAIRWYILSVAAGKPPTDALREQSELLKFCIENVVEGLGDSDKLLLDVLHVLDRPVSFERLAVISEIEIDTLRSGAKNLTQRSLLVRTQASGLDDDADRLSLSATARTFLPPASESDRLTEISSRERALNQARERDRNSLATQGRTFDTKRAYWRSKSDASVAHLLERALRENQAGDASAAAATIRRARAIDASYFDVDRVDAFLASISGRTDQADALYRSAIASCESGEERCWVGYFYSDFLARAFSDFPTAIELAKDTHALFETPETAIRLASLYGSNRQFADAAGLFSWAAQNGPTDMFRLQATISFIDCLREWSRLDRAGGAYAEALDHALRATALGLEAHMDGVTNDKLVRGVNDSIADALRAFRELSATGPAVLAGLVSALQVADDDSAFRANGSWRWVENAIAALPEDLRTRVAPWFIGALGENGAAPTEVVVNEARRIVGGLGRPATLTEVSGRLINSLGEDARRTWAEFGTFKAFLAYAVPTAQIVTDRPPGWVYPDGVPLDRPLLNSRVAAPEVDGDPAPAEVVDETRRIVGELMRPASLPEVFARLIWSMGEDAKRARDTFKSLKAFLEHAVPTAQILTDRSPGWIYPEGVPLDHPLPESWFAAPGTHDDEQLTEIVAEMARQIIGEHEQPIKQATLSGLLMKALGPDARRAWAKPRSFKAFVAHAVPDAQIYSDGTGWVVPAGVTPDPPLLHPWFGVPRTEDDESLTQVVDETRRIVGELMRPASLPEVFARLIWSMGEDAKRARDTFKSLKAFLEHAVPTAQILTDRSPGWIYPEGVPLDHPLPESWFAAPGTHDDEQLTEIVAEEARRMLGDLPRSASLLEVATGLTKALGPDARRAWAKPRSFKAFVAHAVPDAQIYSDGTGWVVPAGVTPDPPLLRPWFGVPRTEDDESLTQVVDETRRIVGELMRPASFPEVFARLIWSMGEDAKRARDTFKSLKAFLEHAVPTAQILTDRSPGWIYPEGVPLDHPLPESWFAAPGTHDDEQLTEIVAEMARQIIGEHEQPIKQATLSGLLMKALGPDARRAWAKPRSFKAFVAHAVPDAQIYSDGTGWVVPAGVTPDPPLLHPWSLPESALTEVVANELQRIVSEFTRPATLAEISALLTRSLGKDADRVRHGFKSFAALLEHAAPTAQLVPDRPPGWVVPEGVTPDPPISTPLPEDDDALMEVAANELRRIVGRFSRPATPADVTARLAWLLGPDVKRAWAWPKTFKTFLEYAVPNAQIRTDSRHGFVVVPEAVTADNSPSDPYADD